MGIFSSKKITYVASSAYNMAGDYPDRMNYTQSTVVGAVMQSSPRNYVGESITKSMLKGPYAERRNLLRWAKKNYSEGIPKMVLGGTSSIDSIPCTTYLNSVKPFTATVNNAYASAANIEQWAKQYVYNKYATTNTDINSLNWTYDFLTTSPPVIVVDIDGVGIFSVPLVNYDPRGLYCYIDYYKRRVWAGTPHPVPSNLNITPAVNGNTIGYIKDLYGTIENQMLSGYEVLTATYHTISGNFLLILKGNPFFLAPYSLDYDGVEYPLDLDYDPVVDETAIFVNIPAMDIQESVPITFIFTAAAPMPVPDVYDDEGPYLEIYKYGSGNPIMEPTKPTQTELSAQMMPFAPIRIENRAIDKAPYKNVYYDKVEQLYKRASGGQKLTKLLATIEDNESIDDIDFAFMVFGVSLNTKSRYTKQYLYEFLLYLRNLQTVNSDTFDIWLNATEARSILSEEIIRVGESVGWESQAIIDLMREYDTIHIPALPYNTISQRSNWLPNLYQIALHWCFCRQESVSPAPHASKKIGDVWFEVLPKKTVYNVEIVERRAGGGEHWREGEYSSDVFDCFYAFRKNSETSVTRIYVVGFQQENIVYNGKSIWIGATEALQDTEESGLICPMITDAYRRLSSKAKNQVAVENTHMIFNCYKIVKQRWYQRGIFKVIFALVLAVASVFFAPAGAGFGILGTNLAVGASVGFVAGSLSAAIAGAVINALAGMIVSQLFSGIAGSLFKGKLGAILGTLIMFFGGMLSSSFSGGSFNLNWGDIFNPKNILNLTNSVTKAATAWYQADIADIQAQSAKEAEKYKTESERIRDLTYKLLGTDGRSFLDPMMFTGESQILNESPESFMDRTLLTGSDIVELSKMMIDEFAEINLQLPEAFQ